MFGWHVSIEVAAVTIYEGACFFFGGTMKRQKVLTMWNLSSTTGDLYRIER
jgi:hypothetical protein